jgi:hypothetical protein
MSVKSCKGARQLEPSPAEPSPTAGTGAVACPSLRVLPAPGQQACGQLNAHGPISGRGPEHSSEQPPEIAIDRFQAGSWPLRTWPSTIGASLTLASATRLASITTMRDEDLAGRQNPRAPAYQTRSLPLSAAGCLYQPYATTSAARVTKTAALSAPEGGHSAPEAHSSTGASTVCPDVKSRNSSGASAASM